jgi:ribosomal protein L15
MVTLKFVSLMTWFAVSNNSLKAAPLAEMTKVEALKHLQSLEQFKSAEDQALIADSLADKEKVKREVKVKATKATKPSVEAIKARAKKAKVSESTQA